MNLKGSKFLKLTLSWKHITRKTLVYCLFFFIVGNPLLLFSQYDSNFIGKGVPSLKSLEKKANAAFDGGDYYTAYNLFEKAVKIDGTKLSNLFRLAEAARNSRTFGLARDAYKLLLELDTINKFPFTKMRLAEMAINKGDTSTAENLLRELEVDSNVLANSELKKLLDRNLENLEFSLSNPQSGNPNVPLKLSINTEWAEINPIWRNGNLYYNTLAFPKEKDTVNPPRKYSKVLFTDLKTDSTTEWRKINIPDTSVAHITFTPDSNRIYFTICDYPKDDGNTTKAILDCQLYYRDKIPGTLDEWNSPIKLPANINQPNFTSTHPTYGLNNLEEPVLFFVTNRNALGKKGDMDIWYTKILDNTTFSNPINLGTPVNTAYNEITPFYHFPSKTLFFSSDGHESLGGYDIYKVRLTDRIEAIENLKQPYNSSSDDRYYSLSDEEDRSFFVTNRFSCNLENIDSVGCDDIYELKAPCRTNLVVLLFDEAKNDMGEHDPITNGRIQLEIGDATFEQEGNKFKYANVDTSIELLHIDAEAGGYFLKNIEESIQQCKNNEIKIFLCKKELHISIYKKDYNEATDSWNEIDDLLDGAIKIKHHSKDKDTSIYLTSNIFIYSYQLNGPYTITAYDNTMKSRDTIFSPGKCPDSIRMLLEYPIDSVPDSIPNTIACYFAHDIPAKSKSGIPDSIAVLPFDIYYPNYSNNRIKEVYRKAFRDNTELVNTFFETKVDQSYNMLEKFKNYLIKRLKDPKPYIITIRGYTSTVGNEDYNKELADRRVRSVEKYFLETHKTEFEKYYKGGYLKIEHEPLGEEGSGYDDPNDKINAIYNPSSAEKRRVEIIIRKTD